MKEKKKADAKETKTTKVSQRKPKKIKEEKPQPEITIDKKEKAQKANNWLANCKLTDQKFNTIEVILIMIIMVFIGLFIGSSLNNNNSNDQEKDMTELEKVYNTIVEQYYDSVNKDKLLEAAVNGMLQYLGDDYTTYLDKEALKDFEERVGGSYYGIGAELAYTTENKTVVSAIFADSPAETAGMKEKDEIYKINGTIVEGKTPAEVAAMIKGTKNSTVKITVKRKNKEITLSLVTKLVNIPSVSGEVLNGEVGYIIIDIFAENTGVQFEKTLKDLENKGIKSLIIDVRDNAGGHLSVVTGMLEIFSQDKSVLYQIKSKNSITKVYDTTKEKRNYPIVVLVNGNSASASEILASSLKENKIATLVGTKTYGKGTVQTTMDLSTGGMLKYTTQNWLTPLGNVINKLGIKPDIEIEMDKKYYEQPTVDNDNQLQKALEILKK